MWIRHAIVLVGLLGSLSAVNAEGFRIEDVDQARSFRVTQIKPGVIAFSDEPGRQAVDGAELTRFEDWARTRPMQKRFLSLFPEYAEPTVEKVTDIGKGPVIDKLYMYVAQARFIVDRPPGAIDLSRYVALPFLERIDPAIKHKAIAAADLPPLEAPQGTGNENPERKWCTERAASICVQSSYQLEGKIPIGVLLVNKLRDSAKKIPDHIDFESELSQLVPTDIDQVGLKELTALDTPIAGVLEQNIFYVNQIIKFGKFFAVFQGHPSDANATVVSAFMVLAIEASVLDKKREFATVPVLRNLVPVQVLMGKSSFNSGGSISAGLPQYARNEIRTIADILERDRAPRP